MKNVVKMYLSTLAVIIAIPVLEALVAMVRLQHQARYLEIFETALVILALAGMWLSFRQFTRKIDDTMSDDEQRRLMLPAWRIALLGAVGVQITMRYLGR
ncbi:MAG: hypothetical protein WBD25_15070 [Terriglobales bacterium]|jgi:hypothetical protein